MLKPYESEKNGEKIDEIKNVKELTGLSREEWIALTGFSKEIEEPIHAEVSGEYPIVVVEIFSQNIFLIREFDIESHIIMNQYFVNDKQGNGTGKKIFSSQVELATKVGFTEIFCKAMRGSERLTYKQYIVDREINFTGYVVWAKVGYKMYQETELEDFNKCVLTFKSINLGYNDFEVNELKGFLQFDLGLKYWKENGFSWEGVYKLFPNNGGKSL